MQDTAPWYRQKRVRIAGVVVAAVAAVAAIVAVVLFVAVQNSPEKALLDTANHALKTPGAYNVVGAGADMAVVYDGARFKADTMISGAPVSIINDNSALYFRSSDPAKLLDLAGSANVSAAMQSTLQAILPTIKDRWIRIDAKDKSFKLPYVDDIRCAADSAKNLADGGGNWQQLTGAYVRNPFLVINKKAETQDSRTFDVTIDQTKLNNFNNRKEAVSQYEALASCQSATMPLDTLAASDGIKATVEIAKADHALKHLTVTDAAGKQMKVTADYTSVPTITVPDDSLGINQVVSLLAQSFFQGR